MLQRLKVTSSIALSALFLLVTAHQSNASTQSEQSITPTNFKHGYLPNYTVNSIESEQTGIKLANSWGHYKKNKRPKRRYSTRYKNSQRYREWKQRKAARSRHHFRLRSVHRAYYKKIKRAERQVIRFELSKRRTIKQLNARYKTNIKRINAQLEKVLAARKSRINARRAKAEAAARAAAAKAQAESQARAAAKAQAESQAQAAAKAQAAVPAKIQARRNAVRMLIGPICNAAVAVCASSSGYGGYGIRGCGMKGFRKLDQKCQAYCLTPRGHEWMMGKRYPGGTGTLRSMDWRCQQD